MVSERELIEKERLIKDRAERQRVGMERLIKGCDPGIVSLVKRLNAANFTTVTSCSGMVTDHGWKEPERSYVAFLKEDALKIERVEKAAQVANMEVTYPIYKPLWYWSSYSPCLEVRTTGLKTDEEIHQAWGRFEKALLGGE